MPSDQRLHPASMIFSVGSHARQLLFPGLAALFAFRSGDWGWQAVAMILFIPASLASAARWLSFRYRLDDDELVVSTGLVFRSVRHIPYDRIHNIDAVQNVAHRLLGVAEVRIETGGGTESEATLQVLGSDAIRQLREHVLARGAPRAAPDTSAVPAGDVVLKLSPRDLMLSGFIQNRGILLVSALVGVLWEFGLVESLAERIFGESIPGRGVLRSVVLAAAGRGDLPVLPLLGAAAGFVVILLALRILSMIWGLISLHGYTLVQQEGDLRAEFGLLTRVTATTPLGRIQTVTVEEGPIHRLFHRASVRVQTAGYAGPEEHQTPQREAVAPVIPSADVPAFLARLHPEFDAGGVAWQPPHDRALRRTFVQSAIVAVVFTSWIAFMKPWWWLAMVPLLLAWAFVHARLYVAHLRWGTSEHAVGLRSGWLWRKMTIARFARIQVVSMSESPFDRRHGMASVLVDTFGASGASHPLDIPYLGRTTARELHHRLIGLPRDEAEQGGA